MKKKAMPSIHVPPNQVSIKTATLSGTIFGDIILQRCAKDKHQFAEVLRELASTVIGSEGMADGGGEIVLILRKGVQS